MRAGSTPSRGMAACRLASAKLVILASYAFAAVGSVPNARADRLQDDFTRLPAPMETIRIRGARTHNLKNVNLDLPRNRLVVITGLSGSG
ncbi:MAG: hypothetical protein JSW68_02710, partial [Burkholderiales bacterium]